ncbi:9379_t:CDS:1, partial [Acaulospora morrowiae]
YKKNLNSTEARACTIVQQKSVQLLETWDSVIRKYSDVIDIGLISFPSPNTLQTRRC